PISDEEIVETPFYRPAEDSPETKYLLERRKALGGFLPKLEGKAPPLKIPPLKEFTSLLKTGSEAASTKSFLLMLSRLLRNKQNGSQIVQIIADEARTFGMDALIREIGIYSLIGQLYETVDSE